MSYNVKQQTGGYPDVTCSHEDKLKPSYGKRWAESILEDWFGSSTASSSNNGFFRRRHESIKKNRAYSDGVQNPEIYKQWMNITGDEGYTAIDWQNMSVIPKFVKLIVDFISKLPEEMSLEATDESSTTSKENYKNELLERLLSKQFIDEAKEAFGAQFQINEFVPEDMEDLEMHLEQNLKQSAEVALEQLILAVFQANDYDVETKRTIIKDIVENAIGAVRVKAHPQKGIKVDIVDIARLVHSPTDYADFRDGFYAGEVKRKSIYEIKIETSSEWDDDKWRKVANSQGGDIYTGQGSGNMRDFYKCKLDVLEFQIRVPNKKKFEKKADKYGNDNVFSKKGGYKPSSKSKYKRELIEDERYTCYEGCYVLGANEIYNWHQSRNIAGSCTDPQDVSLDYRLYIPEAGRDGYRSIVDSMIPAADQMMLAWLKLQQILSQAKPSSIAISADALNQINLGGGEILSYGDAIDIYESTGRLIHSTRDANGDWINSGSPITPLPNELRNLSEVMSSYNFALEQIRNITGITREMEGIIGNRQSAKTVESSIESSSSAISDVAHIYASVTRKAAESIGTLIQDIPREHRLFKMYADIVGAADMEIIEALGDASIKTFGINIRIETDLIKRVQLNKDIEISLGQKEITIEDAMDVREVADKGLMSTASKLFKLRRKKRAKEAAQMEERKQMIQMQMNTQAAKVKSESDIRLLQAEIEAYKQKAAVDLKRFAMETQIKTGAESKKSAQDFLEELEITKIKVGVDGMKQEQALEDAIIKQKHQGEVQKELNEQRNRLGEKQNQSITDLV